MKIAAVQALEMDGVESASAGSADAVGDGASFASFLGVGAGDRSVGQELLPFAGIVPVAPVSTGVETVSSTSVETAVPTTARIETEGLAGKSLHLFRSSLAMTAGRALEPGGFSRTKMAPNEPRVAAKKAQDSVVPEPVQSLYVPAQVLPKDVSGLVRTEVATDAGAALPAQVGAENDGAADDIPRAVRGVGVDGGAVIQEADNAPQARPILLSQDGNASNKDGDATDKPAESGPSMQPASEPPVRPESSAVSRQAAVVAVSHEVLQVAGVPRDASLPNDAVMGTQKNVQRSTHVSPPAADKTNIPAVTSFDAPSVSALSSELERLQVESSAGRGASRSTDLSLPNPGDRGSEASTVTNPVSVVASTGKGGSREGPDSNALPTPSSSNSSATRAGEIAAPGSFVLTLSDQTVATSLDRSSREVAQHPTSLSSSAPSAMERLQTAGATRALGAALQSTLGLGVQTESFGRVTIHTTAEGAQLRAEVTLEDGRQSATLVSHVPAVEQRLMQQFGLTAAVNVSTGGSYGFGGGAGESGHSASQQRREGDDTRTAGRSSELNAGSEAIDTATSATWGGSSNPGRLDVVA